MSATLTLQHEHWKGQPTHLGELFRVRRARGEKQLRAVCQLWTHAQGWKVRLVINRDLKWSEAFRSSAPKTSC